MKLPFISRRRHEAEVEALRRSISKVCNTGCRTAKCQGMYEKPQQGEYGYKHKGKKGHSVAPSGKRLRVTLHDGTQFVAKFKEQEGRFHYFYDHDRVKSSTVRQVSILTTDFKETA